MNGAFYQEEVTKRFESSGPQLGSAAGSIYSDYVNRVTNLKRAVHMALVAADKLNNFIETLDPTKHNERRASLMATLEKHKYMDPDSGGQTYGEDMLGPNGILTNLNKLDDKVGISNDFVAGLHGIGDKFMVELDIYLKKAQNEAVSQAQIDKLKHIRRKGDFILSVNSKTRALGNMSNQVSQKIREIQKETLENNDKRTAAIRGLLSELKNIDNLENSAISTTIMAADKLADQIASANRNLNLANLQQLDRDKKQVVDDVTRSMEVQSKYVPGNSIPTMHNEAPFLKNEVS